MALNNEIIRVLIVENNRDMCDLLNVLISSESDMQVVGIANDGLQAVARIQENPPDVMILDMVMPYLDGMGVLTRMAEMNFARRPKVIILSAFEEESVVAKSSRLGADYYLLKPFDRDILINRIRQVVECEGNSLMKTVMANAPVIKETPRPHVAYKPRQRTGAFDLDAEVTRVLHDLGVPTYFKGYAYLKDTIKVVTEDLSMLGSVTKSLYPKIAEKHGTTSLIVEAAIRYIIQKTWKQGNPDEINKVFGYAVNLRDGKAPTNSFFIAKIAELVRLDMLESAQ